MPSAQLEQAATDAAARNAVTAAKPNTGAANHRVDSAPASRLFDSAMQYLTSHLMPAIRSPFELPKRMTGFVESWATTPWSLGRFAHRFEHSLTDSSVAITAVVAAALIAMTGLTVAGAAIGGRPLKHTAWRLGRARYRPGLPWDMADSAADVQPRRLPVGEDPVMLGPGKTAAEPAAEREAEPAARRRRVA